jgi:hypothetical protein
VCKFEVCVCCAGEDLCLLGYDPIFFLVKHLDYAEDGRRSLLRNVRNCLCESIIKWDQSCTYPSYLSGIMTNKNFAQWGSAVCEYVCVGRSSLKGDFFRFPVLIVKKKSRTRLLRFSCGIRFSSRFQWPRGLKRRSAAARLLRLWIWIPPGALMSVYCECCMLSDRGLCDELITRPEESYRLWCVVVCDLETS